MHGFENNVDGLKAILWLLAGTDYFEQKKNVIIIKSIRGPCIQ